MIDGIPVIDCNVRLPLGGYERTMMYTKPERTRRRIQGTGLSTPASVLDSISLAAAERELQAAGIDGIVLPGRLGSSRFGAAANDELVAYANERPNSAWTLMAVDPAADGWKENIMRGRAGTPSMRGIIVEPGLLDEPRYADDKVCLPLYDYCQQHDIPVALASGGNSEPDCGYSLPIYFDRVARDFPRLKLLIVHGAWPWVLPALHVTQRHENVYLMPDAYILLPGAEPFHAAMAGHLKHRFVFGSAYPFMPPAGLVMRLRKMLNDEAAACFFSGNAKRFLNL